MAAATNTTLGTIKLAGDLMPSGDANSPRLIPSGVKAGTYSVVEKMHVDTKGRTLWVGEVTQQELLDMVPYASNTVAGAMSIGNNITQSSGTISIADASSTVKGVAKIGTGLYLDGSGAVSVSIPIATSSVKGLIKPGVGFKVVNGVLDIDTTELNWTTASASTLGFFKKGSRLLVDGSGVMSVDFPTATTSVLGVVKTGSNITNVAGAISVPLGNPGVKGLLKPRSDQFWFDGDYKINIHWTNKQYGLYGLVAGAGTGISIVDGVMSCSGSFGAFSDATTTSLGNIQSGSGTSITNGILQIQDGSAAQKGILKGGTGVSINSGVLSLTLPVQSGYALGMVKVDGTTITASAGVITPQISALPIPTSSVVGYPKFDSTFSIAGDGTLTSSYGDASTGGTKGFLQAGTNMVVNNGVLDIQPCSASNLGVAKAGSGLAAAGDGTLSIVIPTATGSVFGGIKAGVGFQMWGDVLKIVRTSYSNNGCILVGSGLNEDGAGTISLTRTNSWTGGAFGGQQKFATLNHGVKTTSYSFDVTRKFTTITVNSGGAYALGMRVNSSYYESPTGPAQSTLMPALSQQLAAGNPSADFDFLGTENYLIITQGALGTTQVTQLNFYGYGTESVKIKNFTPGVNILPQTPGAVAIVKFEIVKTGSSTINFAVIGEVLSYS